MSSETSSVTEESDNKPISIVEFGDFRLLVTYSNEPTYFIVSSHAMSLASPVWKTIIHPPFEKIFDEEATIRQSQDRERDFSDDNGEALLILLRIAHLQFNKVPPNLTFKSLFEIAILCDKYDCVSLVKPWLSTWLTYESTQYMKPGNEEMLLISWVFGKETIFRELAKKLVTELKTNDQTDCLTATKEKFLDQMPLDIIENILTIRSDTIRKLLDVPYKHIDQLTNQQTVCHLRSRPCDALVYGSLLQNLLNIDLWPRKSPKTVKVSIRDLDSQLKSMEIYEYPHYPDRYPYNTPNHSSCTFKTMKNDIETILSGIPDPVLESHLRHMEIQRQKLDFQA